MDISPNIYTVDLSDEKVWLGSEHGTDCTESITLNIPEFQAIGAVETTYEPNGRIVYRIRSGTPIVKDAAANLYGPVMTLGAKLATPVQNAPTQANAGGTLAAGTVLNCLGVTAVTAAGGETVAGNAESITINAGTNTNEATFSVQAVAGAVNYRFYFGPAGGPATGYVQQAGTSLTLTAAPVTTAGTPPTVDGSAAWVQGAKCDGHLFESVLMYKLPSGLYKAGGALLWHGKVRLSKLPLVLGGQPWSVSAASSPAFNPNTSAAPQIRYIPN